MQFIKPNVNINFIGKRNIAFFLSAIAILVGILSLIIHRGPKLGIDFKSGTLIQIKFSSPVDIADIKSGLAEVNLGNTSVQRFGDAIENEYLLRTDTIVETTEDLTLKMEKALNTSTGASAKIRRVEMVGPQVGKDLRKKHL